MAQISHHRFRRYNFEWTACLFCRALYVQRMNRILSLDTYEKFERYTSIAILWNVMINVHGLAY